MSRSTLEGYTGEQDRIRGRRRKLVIERLWVQISIPDTRCIFCCRHECIVDWKDRRYIKKSGQSKKKQSGKRSQCFRNPRVRIYLSIFHFFCLYDVGYAAEGNGTPLFIKYGPNPTSQRLYSSSSQCNDKYSTKFDYIKLRWCAWESNLGLQDGRRERIQLSRDFYHLWSSLNLKREIINGPPRLLVCHQRAVHKRKKS